MGARKNRPDKRQAPELNVELAELHALVKAEGLVLGEMFTDAYGTSGDVYGGSGLSGYLHCRMNFSRMRGRWRATLNSTITDVDLYWDARTFKTAREALDDWRARQP